MRKRLCLFVVFAMLMLLFAACEGDPQQECYHCHEEKKTNHRLIGSVDMELCDDCYSGYLSGEWGNQYTN